ncbi:unnamed protein product, partial [Pseudo-nitzschia multistriata]
ELVVSGVVATAFSALPPSPPSSSPFHTCSGRLS